MLKNVIRGLTAAAMLIAGPAMGQVATQADGQVAGNGGWADVGALAGNDAPVIVCFAEGTDEKYVAQVMAYVNAYNEQFDERYHTGTRWSGTQGTTRTVTWSFVPDGLSITGSGGEATSASNLFAKMDSKYARATWIARIQSCFDRWQELSGLTITRITSGGNDWDDGAAWGSAGNAARGDIRISMHPIDGSSNVLAYTFFPSNGDMVIDSDDINNYGNANNQSRFLRNTVTHELGHAFGLNHTCSSNSAILMEPFLSTSYDGPRHDDIRGIQRHYGDVSGNITTSGAARDLGTLSSGVPINIGTPVPNPLTGTNDSQVSTASLDDDGEADWYKFNTTASLTFSATLTPMGKSYDDSSQASSGSCNTGTTTNSLAILNMKIEVYASNGTTLLGSADATGAGSSETLSGLGLSAGTYFVKISAAAGTSASQLYTLSLSGSGCTPPSISGNPSDLTRCTGASATFTVTASNATGYQWRKNTANISGATSSSYTIPSVTTGDAGSYDCVVSNACSNVTSNPATLTVNTTANITGHPSDQSKCEGDSASFSVTATGATGYQWRKNTANISGATSSTYTIPSVVSGDAGSYDCVVSNSCGNVTSNPATLTVGADPSITGQPTGGNVCRGGSITLTVTATGATGYQWRQNLVNINGANSGSYTIDPAAAGDTGSYDCVVTNSCGSATSDPAVVTVCLADFNCDGFVNGDDYDAFAELFETADNGADINGDGFVNGDDYDVFAEAFESGC